MKPVLFHPTIDYDKVNYLVYHLPNGGSVIFDIKDSNYFFDLHLQYGDICDTSDIDGLLHFFPRGNA